MDNSYPKADAFSGPDGQSFFLVLAVPGCKEDDISISYEYQLRQNRYFHRIVVSGCMNQCYKEIFHDSFNSLSKNVCGIKELKHSKFSREFLFQEDLLEINKNSPKDSIDIELKDGLLIIKLLYSQKYRSKTNNQNKTAEDKVILHIKKNGA